MNNITLKLIKKYNKKSLRIIINPNVMPHCIKHRAFGEVLRHLRKLYHRDLVFDSCINTRIPNTLLKLQKLKIISREKFRLMLLANGFLGTWYLFLILSQTQFLVPRISMDIRIQKQVIVLAFTQ